MTTPSWINSIVDAKIRSDLTADAADGAFSYTEMLTLLQDVAAEVTTYLSSDQYSDLQYLVSNLENGVYTSSYVSSLLAYEINGNSFNNTWTHGGSSSSYLGNLSVWSTSLQLSELTSKWFQGSDLPSNSFSLDGYGTLDITYKAKATVPLYASGGPAISDINQGLMGDCYLLAALGEAAQRNSSLITSMLTSNGNNTYGVRFFINGQAEWITVNNYLPTINYDGYTILMGNDAFNNAQSTTSMWVGLIEKAVAQSDVSAQLSSGSYQNSYNSMGDGGYSDDVLAVMTNGTITYNYYTYSTSSSASVFDISINTTTSWEYGYSVTDAFGYVTAALAAGDDVLFSSFSNTYDSKGTLMLDTSHEYSVIGFDSSTGKLILRNPWGTMSGWTPSVAYDTTFELGLSDLTALGSTSDYFTIDNIKSVKPIATYQTVAETLTLGQAVSITMSGDVQDTSGAGLTYSAKLANGSALPSWLTLNSQSGVFTGTAPTSASTVSLLVTATNLFGNAVTETLVLNLTGNASTVLLAGPTVNIAGLGYSGIELLQTSSTNTVTYNLNLSELSSNGSTIVGTTGADVLSSPDSVMNLTSLTLAGIETVKIGSSAGTTLTMGAGQLSAVNTLIGGSGVDTLMMSQGNWDFSAQTLSGIEVIRTQDVSLNLTLGASDLTGLTSVVGTTGSDTVYLVGDSLNLSAMALSGIETIGVQGISGTDTLVVAQKDLTAATHINGLWDHFDILAASGASLDLSGVADVGGMDELKAATTGTTFTLAQSSLMPSIVGSTGGGRDARSFRDGAFRDRDSEGGIDGNDLHAGRGGRRFLHRRLHRHRRRCHKRFPGDGFDDSLFRRNPAIRQLQRRHLSGLVGVAFGRDHYRQRRCLGRHFGRRRLQPGYAQRDPVGRAGFGRGHRRHHLHPGARKSELRCHGARRHRHRRHRRQRCGLGFQRRQPVGRRGAESGRGWDHLQPGAVFSGFQHRRHHGH